MDEKNLLYKFIKDRLRQDFSFFGCENQWRTVYDLLIRTAEVGESNSALLIGPRGAGKTALISSVLRKIVSEDSTFHENMYVIYLNGFIHTDDRIVLKSVTTQMNLDNVTDNKVFGSFAENFLFLLECIKCGDKKSKSIAFILEEFDLFCGHHNQTFLYNLFDITQTAQTPVCVLGVTSRLDVVELLEKRVKSRFSHRQIHLFLENENFEEYCKLFFSYLKLPSKESHKNISPLHDITEYIQLYTLKRSFNPKNYNFSRKYIQLWNSHMDTLLKDSVIVNILRKLYDFDGSNSFMKTFIYALISKLNKNKDTTITSKHFQIAFKEIIDSDHRVILLCELSMVEMCLLIAMKHHTEIYNGDPFNFEIIYNRLMKFISTSTVMQGVEKIVVLKAFEHLRNLEFIQPITSVGFSSGTGYSKSQKEFRMHHLLLTKNQIDKSLSKYEALPTEISQWAHNVI